MKTFQDSFGQLIFTGIKGVALDTDEEKFIKNEDIGGVILFERNYESVGQLGELVNSIQRLRREFPLFIGVDQEGGRVQRFKKPFTHFPPMIQIGQLGSPKLCFQVSKIISEELNSCGINLNFGPCCDILTNPQNKVIGDRAFSTEEEVVTKFVSSSVRGFKAGGVISCAKHFPGHGATTKDSHFDLPIVKTPYSLLKDREFKPFIKAIKSRVEFIMTAHIIVDSIDQDYPASLSEKVHKILRKDLQYKKIIISDDMTMKAIADHYELIPAATLALNAGTDILLYQDVGQSEIVLEGIKKEISAKKIKTDLIQEKLGRIIKCKKTYLKDYFPIFIPDSGKKINTKENQILLEELKNKISKSSSQLS